MRLRLEVDLNRPGGGAGFACAGGVVGCLRCSTRSPSHSSLPAAAPSTRSEVIAKAIHDGLEHDSRVTSEQFRAGLAEVTATLTVGTLHLLG